MTALDAERAFAADARRIGQWAAFRRWAAADADMFVPEPVKAQEWLRGRADPRQLVVWSPIASYVSCDGNTAVNTGEWRRADGSVGYFTTVWQRQAGGQWRWTMDHGDVLAAPRRRTSSPAVRRAACGAQGHPPFPAYRHAGVVGPQRQADGSLRFYWRISARATPLPREFYLALWNGSTWELPIHDHVPLRP